MTALLACGVQALAASTGLMLLVLLVRAPLRRAIGPPRAFALWLLPALRLVTPPLLLGPDAPLGFAGATTGRMLVLAVGAPGPALGGPSALTTAATVALALWLAGALALLALFSVRHRGFCRHVRRTGAALHTVGTISVVATDVEGPVAFGLFRRTIAVPRDFALRYDAREQELALAHEAAHHARGDLLANWIALVVLALHWWNPVAWIAAAAFRQDQEYAADAAVVARADLSARATYAALLAKAAGVGAPPACNLIARSSLKGRLIMLDPRRQRAPHGALGTALAVLLGGGALALTAVAPAQSRAPAGRQAVTIAVKPDGSGSYALVVDGVAVAPGAALPGGRSLPADFGKAGGCNLAATAQPIAAVIKGDAPDHSYTVMCASAGAADVRATLQEGLASLRTMRTSVATQPASTVFPEAERAHALAAIDRSVREVQATLAALG